jgi:autotransporter-associated beta strand protein
MLRSWAAKNHPRPNQQPRFRPSVEHLEDRLVPSTLHWTGAASGSWSVANNWLENRAPTNGDIVAFDTTAATVQNFSSNNDITNLGLAGVVVNDTDPAPGHDFSITGNGVYLAGALTSTTTGGATSLGLSSITLLNPTTWTNNAGTLNVASNVNINGMQLTVDGAGNTVLSGVVSGLNSPAGLRGDYYAVPQGASPALLDPTSSSWLGVTAPTVTAVTPNVYFANVFPDSFAPYANVGVANVAARWTGWINIPTSGNVDFYTGSDDGSRLFIDGNLVVDNNGFHGWNFLGGSINLTAGLHQIDIEYFQWVASGEIAVGWDPTGSGNPNNSVVIPASAFSLSDGLIKTGTGALTLTGAETYAGPTTVNGGTLEVNGSLAAASAVTVNAGGTLGGSGSVGGAVTVNVGGTIEPGARGAVLSTGGVTFGAGTTFRVALDGAAPGTGYDQLNVTGAINLNGAALTGTLGFTPAPGETFVIISNNGASPITGTFAGLSEGSAVTLGGHLFHVSYHGGKGNDVVLTADRAPVAGAASLSYSLNENQTLSVAAPGLLAGASDPDGDPVSVALGTGPAHGTLTLGPGGSFTYTPAANFFGTDSFTYTVTDGELNSAPVTVTFSVAGTGVPITGKGVAVHGYEHDALKYIPVATFVLGGGAVPPGSIAAIIDWGDGTKSLGKVVSSTGTVYTVLGSHTYREEGNYKVTVSLSVSGGGASATIRTTASVLDERHHHRRHDHHRHHHHPVVELFHDLFDGGPGHNKAAQAIEALLEHLHLPSTGHTGAIDLAFLEFPQHYWT